MLIIAEFGSSPAAHGWDFDRWNEGARAAGAQAVKVQLFKAEHFPTGEQDSKRPLEFPRARFRNFVMSARSNGLIGGASVFDPEAADIASQYGDFIKLAAREQDNSMLIGFTFELAEKRGLPVYRSISRMSQYHYHPLVTTLFTIPVYPAGMVISVLALLRAAWEFRARGARWGWSSHTRGDMDCVLAARLGAHVLEKHFALGKTDLESGHSLLPHEFSRMVEKCQ